MEDKISLETLVKVNNSSLLAIAEMVFSVELLLADVFNGKAMRYNNGMLDQDAEMLNQLREIHNVINGGGIDKEKIDEI